MAPFSTPKFTTPREPIFEKECGTTAVESNTNLVFFEVFDEATNLPAAPTERFPRKYQVPHPPDPPQRLKLPPVILMSLFTLILYWAAPLDPLAVK